MRQKVTFSEYMRESYGEKQAFIRRLLPEKWRRRFIRGIFTLLLGSFALFLCMPVLLLITGSVTSDYELRQNLLPLMAGTDRFLSWTWMPDYPTFSHYAKVLFYTPQFFIVFWNSVKLVSCILIGQLLIGIPAAWAFAVYPTRGSKLLFTLYIVLMLLPFQVTMLSSYLVLDALELMNTHLAIILPAVFSTFPVFLIYRSFCGIPKGLLEAARIDGAGEFRIFLKLGLPLGSTGILSAVVLGFLEYWNLIEQPLAFLEDMTLWPLSLYLPEINLTRAGYAFVASILTLIPAAFVFVLGQDYLEQGIIASGLKE